MELGGKQGKVDRPDSVLLGGPARGGRQTAADWATWRSLATETRVTSVKRSG